MKNFLIVFTADHPDGLKIALEGPQMLVGRDPRCNFRPELELVSKLHCAFLIDDRGVALRDLKSTNGTFVNGKRVADTVELKDGDQIRLATLSATFRRIAANAPAPAATPAAPEPAGKVADPLAATAMQPSAPAAAAPVAAAHDPDFDPLGYLFDGASDDSVPATVAEVNLPSGPPASDTVAMQSPFSDTATTATPPAPKPDDGKKKGNGNTRDAATAALAAYMAPRRGR